MSWLHFEFSSRDPHVYSRKMKAGGASKTWGGEKKCEERKAVISYMVALMSGSWRRDSRRSILLESCVSLRLAEDTETGCMSLSEFVSMPSMLLLLPLCCSCISPVVSSVNLKASSNSLSHSSTSSAIVPLLYLPSCPFFLFLSSSSFDSCAP